MPRRRLSGFVHALLAVASVAALAGRAGATAFEVWLVDQANSAGVAWGGTIHVFAGDELMGEDLAGTKPETNVVQTAYRLSSHL